jgi:nucleotidyltransferase substrate binding protein (TIGR01987 family)
MNTDHLLRIATTLEQALAHLDRYTPDDELYDLFRNAAIKSFELGLESGGKALRRALKAYLGSSRTADALSFNDVIRQSLKHGIFTSDEAERWLKYRVNRNTTAHDYGERFANETLVLLPSFASDLRQIAVPLRIATE